MVTEQGVMTEQDDGDRARRRRENLQGDDERKTR